MVAAVMDVSGIDEVAVTVVNGAGVASVEDVTGGGILVFSLVMAVVVEEGSLENSGEAAAGVATSTSSDGDDDAIPAVFASAVVVTLGDSVAGGVQSRVGAAGDVSEAMSGTVVTCACTST